MTNYTSFRYTTGMWSSRMIQSSVVGRWCCKITHEVLGLSMLAWRLEFGGVELNL